MANNEGRVLTVSGAWNAGREIVPSIRLRGSWLNAFGFKVGEKFQVIYSFEAGTLLLQKVSKL
jgi:hypothetical protein